MHSSSAAKKVNTAPFATQINPQQSQYPWKITLKVLFYITAEFMCENPNVAFSVILWI